MIKKDVLKTKDKCLRVCRDSLQEGSSVVIDNTNPTADVRLEYISLAKGNYIII